MDRQQILDDIEEIQDRNNETFIGCNEADRISKNYKCTVVVEQIVQGKLQDAWMFK